MRETICFDYHFDDGEGGIKRVSAEQHADDRGLRCEIVCENFVQFMESVGFSTDQIIDYFRR